MGVSFRNTNEITELAGCDGLTISPAFLKKLQESNAELPRKSEYKRQILPHQEPITEAEFLRQHYMDAMAVEILPQDIRNFAADTEKLEDMLLSKL